MGYNRTIQRIFLFFSILFFLTIISITSINAEDYYADISIDLDSYGYVTINGVTNYPELLINNTPIYTSKTQSYWLLNITKNEVFSDFVYALNLPKGSSINYIKSSGFIRIEENQGSLLIKGFGENESLSLIVQYQIDKTSETSIIMQFDLVFIILILAIIIIIALLVFFIIKDRKEKLKIEEPKRNDNDVNFNGLNDRQKQIMKLLIEGKMPLTQTDIQKELNMPKAAVSRNIRRLELKGLIEKEQIGMSNLIRLKKQ